jgi:multidrug efflux pump
MSLSSISIKKPVLAIVFSLLLLIFGTVGFLFLGVREYPAMDPPIVTVTTTYVGATADIIESQVTEPLEQAVNGIPGIRELSSSSKEQVSQIRVEFNLNVDLETAANDVRDRVSRAIRNLPRDIENPVVEKADANSDAIVFMTVSSETKSAMEITEVANNIIKEKLQTIEGVSFVRIFGEKKMAMRLWLDPHKMHAHQVTPADIQQALNKENIELPTGRIEGYSSELTVRTSGLLKTPNDFNHLLIKHEQGNSVFLSEIGYAEYAPENLRTAAKRAGKPMVGVAIIAQTGANAIEIVDEFYKRLEIIKTEIPKDIKLDIGYDFTTFVRKAIGEVEETLYIAFALVVLIIFAFLRDWRSTLIPVLAIPVSIIASFFIMYVSGFSINLLTLMAVVLAIGLVCDDAIVVLENIYSKIEDGMEPEEAALKGSEEIYFAIISTTVTLAAVFLPVIFLQGLTGRLFKEFGITIAGAILISAFVALTLSPMLSAKLLKKSKQKSKLYSLTEPFFQYLNQAYENSLERFLQKRWSTWFWVILSLVLIVIFIKILPGELAPIEDRSNIRVNATAPEGVSYEYMEQSMDMLSKFIIDSVPEITTPITIVAPGFGGQVAVNNGFQNLYFSEPFQRKRSQQQIYDQLTLQLKELPTIKVSVSQPPTIGSRFSGPPIQFIILSPSFDSLKTILPKFLEEARKRPELAFVDSDLKFTKPELQISINRDKAAQLGVSTDEIAKTLQLALSGQRYGYFFKNGKQYQIIGQLSRNYRDTPQDIAQIHVRNKNGLLIPLESVIAFEEKVNPTSRFRFNRYVSATVQAGTTPGYILSDGIKALNEVKNQVLNNQYQVALGGQARDFSDSSNSLYFAFMLALLLIYLILAAQFESFIDPLIILFTVPLALSGALLSLWYFNQTLNVFSQIGIIMLIGLVTKNGILIVEFANQKKLIGLSSKQAVIAAATDRLRPILMTTLSTILGILPIALSLGNGAAGSRVSMGIAVVGGLVFSGALTLFIIPGVYTWMSKSKSN